MGHEPPRQQDPLNQSLSGIQMVENKLFNMSTSGKQRLQRLQQELKHCTTEKDRYNTPSAQPLTKKSATVTGINDAMGLWETCVQQMQVEIDHIQQQSNIERDRCNHAQAELHALRLHCRSLCERNHQRGEAVMRRVGLRMLNRELSDACLGWHHNVVGVQKRLRENRLMRRVGARMTQQELTNVWDAWYHNYSENTRQMVSEGWVCCVAGRALVGVLCGCVRCCGCSALPSAVISEGCVWWCSGKTAVPSCKWRLMSCSSSSSWRLR